MGSVSPPRGGAEVGGNGGSSVAASSARCCSGALTSVRPPAILLGSRTPAFACVWESAIRELRTGHRG